MLFMNNLNYTWKQMEPHHGSPAGIVYSHQTNTTKHIGSLVLHVGSHAECRKATGLVPAEL